MLKCKAIYDAEAKIMHLCDAKNFDTNTGTCTCRITNVLLNSFSYKESQGFLCALSETETVVVQICYKLNVSVKGIILGHFP